MFSNSQSVQYKGELYNCGYLSNLNVGFLLQYPGKNEYYANQIVEEDLI